MAERLIDSISLPAGLKDLSTEQLEQVTHELRDELIDTVSQCGGHFASSLGAAEISVALHHVFHTPHDRLVWDVGHQAYVHKMLTGRRSFLPTIRQSGGLSGFLKRNESPYDAFGAGHAGTSISAAVGMAVGLQRTDPERHVVAVIGDGSLTAGMAFEAFNHAGDLGLKNLIVVINDNEMSISPNVGALSWLFSRAATSHRSNSIRSRFKDLYRKGYVPEFIYKTIDKAEEATQGFISTPGMLFSSFGFRYIGPVDGHSITDLVQSLRNAKEQDIPTVIHAITQKGKGYDAAEEDPITWHGVTPFDRSRASFSVSTSPTIKPPPSYTSVFADTLCDLAAKDPRIVAITAAMPTGTGLDKFQAKHPQAFYDVGICEQHAVTFAAGLACEGLKPVCAIYSTFLQRAYDQVVHDVAIQNLPVVFAIDRGGVVGNDGETHQGVFDISYLRAIPHMVIMSPKDEHELRAMLATALSHSGPVALRYPRGSGTGLPAPSSDGGTLAIGKGEVLCRGTDALLIAFGPMVQFALAAGRKLAEDGISCTVINARFAKPLDRELFAKEIPLHRLVCTLEDHAVAGGFGSAVLELIHEEGLSLAQPVYRFGVGDEFVPHASQTQQHRACGYDSEAIVRWVKGHLAPHSVAAAG